MKRRDMGIGIGLVVLGLIFLFGPMLNLAEFGWPFFVIIPGVILLVITFVGQVGNGALAVPGSIVTTTGLILLVLNLAGRMDAWAYAWALVWAATGIGFYIYGIMADSARLKAIGRNGALIGLTVFIVLALIFEFFIFGTFRNVLRWLLPALLLLAGAWLLYQGTRKRSAPTPQGTTATTDVPPPPPPGPAAGHLGNDRK